MQSGALLLYAAVFGTLLLVPPHQLLAFAWLHPGESSDGSTSVAIHLCGQRLQVARSYRFHHWIGLPPDAQLYLPTCCSGDGCNGTVWFEGHVRSRRRLLQTSAGGRLLHGCAHYYRYSHGLRLVLRPESCRQQSQLSLTVTCLAAAGAEVHVLQLAGDRRCPPGTRRDRLGLCRQCDGGGSGDPCCWQPEWEATDCPAGCANTFGWGAGSDPDADGGKNRFSGTFDAEQAESFGGRLRRARRAASENTKILAKVKDSQAITSDQIQVAQLFCPELVSIMATVVCLTEMHYPVSSEVVSLMLTSFTTVAFLCMPIYVCYVLAQLYSAQFLPFLQFHLFERSALLTSSLRTQATFAPSLWDFQAFKEAERRRQVMEKQKSAKKKNELFRLRELHSLLLWDGLRD